VNARAEAAPRSSGSRLWAIAPLALLLAIVLVFSAYGEPITSLLGHKPPPADEFDVRRVEFHPGEIRVKVTNPQPDELTIASVTVDDAIVPFALDGPRELGRLRSSTIVVPFEWIADEPIAVGITSSTGIETVEEVAAAIETPQPSVTSAAGFAAIGFLVGVVPVGLGLLWLPSLRRVSPRLLAAFMALTAGLLAFVGIEALSEALDLQATLPSAFGGTGIVLLGVAGSWFGLSAISGLLRRRGGRDGPLGGVALASLVAVGIGLHNLGEGLAIGSSFALGELALGTFLIVGFMIHNLTEGLGIAAPMADGEAGAGIRRLLGLTAIAGAPAILGAWIGGFLTNDVLGVLFFGAAAGAAFQVVTELARYLARKAPAGLSSPHVLGGFVAGIAVMYATGLLAG
jgi:zinc transporter, ZIP family